jgi:hypothetical protein
MYRMVKALLDPRAMGGDLHAMASKLETGDHARLQKLFKKAMKQQYGFALKLSIPYVWNIYKEYFDLLDTSQEVFFSRIVVVRELINANRRGISQAELRQERKARKRLEEMQDNDRHQRRRSISRDSSEGNVTTYTSSVNMLDYLEIMHHFKEWEKTFNAMIRAEALDIYDKYVVPDAGSQVNISASAVESLSHDISDGNIHQNMFAAAAQEVAELMATDSFGRFTRSELFEEFLEDANAYQDAEFAGAKAKTPTNRRSIKLSNLSLQAPSLKTPSRSPRALQLNMEQQKEATKLRSLSVSKSNSRKFKKITEE